MVQLKYILWFFWSLLSLKSLESMKIYVVEIQDEDKTLSNDYGYDIHDEFFEAQSKKIPTNYRNEHVDQDVDQDVNQDLLRNVIICYRRLGKLVDVNEFKRCLKSYSDNGRSNRNDYIEKTNEYSQHNSLYRNGDNTNKKNKHDLDLTRLPEDFSEVGDLEKSEKFADDYIDVGDFRSSVLPECSSSERDQSDEINKASFIPASRRADSVIKNIMIDQYFDNIERSKKKKPSRPISDSIGESSQASEGSAELKYIEPEKKQMSSEKEDEVVTSEHQDYSSEIEEKSPKKQKKTRLSAKIKLPKKDRRKQKLKRYKVISYKKDESVDSNNDSDKAKLNSESERVDFSSDAELFPASGLSEEVTTKRPRKKKSEKGADDKYVYLQGNNLYDSNDFTRRRRLTHFLPKRQYWKEEDFSKLGYFWFQGPKGKYPVN